LAALVAACAPRAEPDATAGGPGAGNAFSLRGQVPIAYPPGTRDATEKVRREAAERCPGGFVIRSLNTSQPASPQFVDRTINYDAVVACTAPGAR
jgi:hypothetical protein